MTQLVQIENVLALFNSNDKALPIKLQALYDYLGAARLEAIYRNKKEMVNHFTSEIQLISAAIKNYDQLNK